MKSYTLASLLATLLLSSSVDAQLVTTTLPWDEGNTLVVSTGTNALGVPVTVTVSTIVSTGLVTATGLSSSSSSLVNTLLDPLDPVTSSSSSSSSSRRATLATTATTADPDEDPDARPTTTTQRGQVGQPEETNGPPMRTTTYWYDPGDGNYVQATWTATNTAPPLTPTAVVPEGTVLDYQQYQTSVNRAVISAAVAADSRSNTTSGAGTRIRPVDAAFAGTAGWMAMAAGVVGMGWGVWAL